MQLGYREIDQHMIFWYVLNHQATKTLARLHRHILSVSDYGKEMAQSHTADQPSARWEDAEKTNSPALCCLNKQVIEILTHDLSIRYGRIQMTFVCFFSVFSSAFLVINVFRIGSYKPSSCSSRTPLLGPVLLFLWKTLATCDFPGNGWLGLSGPLFPLRICPWNRRLYWILIEFRRPRPKCIPLVLPVSSAWAFYVDVST